MVQHLDTTLNPVAITVAPRGIKSWDTWRPECDSAGSRAYAFTTLVRARAGQR